MKIQIIVSLTPATYRELCRQSLDAKLSISAHIEKLLKEAETASKSDSCNAKL